MPAHSSETIAALIGSRICHDLISPIGAVNNGLELLALSGVPQGPEMSLVADSAANANARICLFRLAFGIASDGQATTAQEIARTWADAMADRKLALDWRGPDSLARPLAQAILLALLCLEKALPQGGALRVTEHADQWTAEATGPALNADAPCWDMLAGHSDAGEIAPSHVQFLLLPRHLDRLGRRCTLARAPDRLSLTL